MSYKRHFAELIGTFILVFAGTAAIVVNDISGGVITHVGITLVFGLVVAALITPWATSPAPISIRR